MLLKNDKHTSQNIKKKIFEDDKEKKRNKFEEKLKEIHLERKKSIHERLGPLNPLSEYSKNTFSLIEKNP